jgi:hypothetical protein
MVLGLIQPLTEMNTRILAWGERGKERPELKTDNLTVIYEPIV